MAGGICLYEGIVKGYGELYDARRKFTKIVFTISSLVYYIGFVPPSTIQVIYYYPDIFFFCRHYLLHLSTQYRHVYYVVLF